MNYRLLIRETEKRIKTALSPEEFDYYTSVMKMILSKKNVGITKDEFNKKIESSIKEMEKLKWK